MSDNLLRHRPPQPSRFAPQAPLDRWTDWANIGDIPTRQIADRLLADDVADYVRFRAACVQWREHTDDPKRHSVLDPRFHPRRWILLPEAQDATSPGSRMLLNLSHGKKITVDLPDLVSGNVAVAAGSGGSPGGVLVLMDELSLVFRLMNPLTGQFVNLPSVASVLSRGRMGRLDKKFFDLCKVTGAGFAGESTVVLHFGWDNRLVSTRLGDERWEVISEGSLLCSAFPFYGKVYFANWDGLMVVDADVTPPKLVHAAEWPSKDPITLVHMADNSGELVVLINKVHFQEGDDYTVDFEVVRLDADAEMLIPVTDLDGDRSLFAGDYGGALAISSTGIIPNAIYFQHDRHNKFYVRRMSDGITMPLSEAPGSSFIDDLTSYVASNGSRTRVAPACSWTP